LFATSYSPPQGVFSLQLVLTILSFNKYKCISVLHKYKLTKKEN
jgi:hypothetical protein